MGLTRFTSLNAVLGVLGVLGALGALGGKGRSADVVLTSRAPSRIYDVPAGCHVRPDAVMLSASALCPLPGDASWRKNDSFPKSGFKFWASSADRRAEPVGKEEEETNRPAEVEGQGEDEEEGGREAEGRGRREAGKEVQA